MAPIYDSDIAKERWSQKTWENIELWEKVEVRLRRRRYLWIAGMVSVFLFILALPTCWQREPKYESLKAIRRFSKVISDLRLQAIQSKMPHRIVLLEGPGLGYRIEKGVSCSGSMDLVTEGTVLSGREKNPITWVRPNDSARLHLKPVLSEFCFDPIQGAIVSGTVADVRAFAVAPVSDLTGEPRLDRIAIMILNGNSAEISFE